MTGRPKISWNDFMSGKASDLMKHYKVSEKGLQQELHRHINGAPPKERQEIYKKVYDKKG